MIADFDAITYFSVINVGLNLKKHKMKQSHYYHKLIITDSGFRIIPLLIQHCSVTALWRWTTRQKMFALYWWTHQLVPYPQ